MTRKPLHGKQRAVIVVEYRADEITPEIVAAIGQLVRDRFTDDRIGGAVFVAAHVAVGTTAFRILEHMPD